ncbi:MAG: hypothetical protein RLZZ408_1435 [Verrucomicrobiota bacterium]|jgi:hypothetical protein
MTYQIHEKLILNGESVFMLNFPNIPKDHPRILDEYNGVPDSYPLNIGRNSISSTACYRGYIGVWEIQDGQFFLKDLFGHRSIDGPDPVPATWFSGCLVLPQGNIIEGDPCFGWDVVRERDLLIKIRKGKVVKEEIRVNCTGFFRRQFSRIPVIGKLVLKSQGQP